jgi:hypothetical protein
MRLKNESKTSQNKPKTSQNEWQTSQNEWQTSQNEWAGIGVQSIQLLRFIIFELSVFSSQPGTTLILKRKTGDFKDPCEARYFLIRLKLGSFHKNGTLNIYVKPVLSEKVIVGIKLQVFSYKFRIRYGNKVK